MSQIHRLVLILLILNVSITIMTAAPTPNPTTATSDVDNPELHSLNTRITRLVKSEGRWHVAYLWLILATVLLSLGVFFAQYFEAGFAKQRADAEAELGRVKDRIHAAEFGKANERAGKLEVQAESFKADAEKSRAAIASAQADAAKANARAAEANLELAKLKEPRTLLPERQDRIISAMKRFSGQRFAFSVFSDPESLALVRTLDATLKAAGWQRIDSQIGAVTFDVGGATAGMSNDSGVHVFIAPEDAGAMPAVQALASTLTSEGIPCVPNTTVQLTGKTPTAITINVGKKP